MRKMNLVSRVMNEVISYGGIPLRRCDAYKHALSIQGNDKGMFGADYQAFRPEVIGAEPWTLAEFESLMAGNMKIPERFRNSLPS